MQMVKCLTFIRPQYARYFSTQAESKTYRVGDKISAIKKITEDDVKNFMSLTGDTNSVHLQDGQKNAVVHGALLNGFVSGVIGTKLPGPGTLVVSQSLNFPNKCYVNDVVTIKIELTEVRKIIKVKFSCEVDSEKKIVLYGDAKLILTDLKNKLK